MQSTQLYHLDYVKFIYPLTGPVTQILTNYASKVIMITLW